MTPRERERRYYLMQRIGCVPCRHRGNFGQPADVHHPNLDGHAGQKRLGDDINYSACEWHHRGQPLPNTTAELCRTRLGPSRAIEPNAYRAEFGTEEELLAEMERLIERYESNFVGRVA